MSLCGGLKISMKLFGDFNISTKCCHHISGSLVENPFRDVFREGFSYKYAMNLKSVQKEGLPGPFLAVYCMSLITCCFSKYFQIMYILAKIFKYFALFKNFFGLFLPFFWKIAGMPLLSRTCPVYRCFSVGFTKLLRTFFVEHLQETASEFYFCVEVCSLLCLLHSLTHSWKAAPTIAWVALLKHQLHGFLKEFSQARECFLS